MTGLRVKRNLMFVVMVIDELVPQITNVQLSI